jgi:hypothetical protein
MSYSYWQNVRLLPMKPSVITDETSCNYWQNIRLLLMKHLIITDEAFGYYQQNVWLLLDETFSYYWRSVRLLLTKLLVITNKMFDYYLMKHSVISDEAFTYYWRTFSYNLHKKEDGGCMWERLTCSQASHVITAYYFNEWYGWFAVCKCVGGRVEIRTTRYAKIVPMR